MARTPRTGSRRAIRVWPGQDKNDEDGGSLVILTATTYSLPLHGPEATGLTAYHILTTAGLTGVYTIQGSLVPNPELTTDDDWTTLTTGLVVHGSSLTLAGAAGNSLVTLPDTLLEWTRVKYTHTSGGGTVRVFARVDNNH